MARMALVSKKAWDFGILVFALFVLGASAYFMSQGQTVDYESDAARKTQFISGKLIKKGSPEFLACTNIVAPYAIAESCTPVTLPADAADPLVGKKVMIEGIYRNKTFYGKIVGVEGGVKPTPKSEKVIDRGYAQ